MMPFGAFGGVQLNHTDVGNETVMGGWTFCGAVKRNNK